MHSLNSIVEIVLTDTENYIKWLRNINITLIFNDLWDGFCEGESIERVDDELGLELKSKEEGLTKPTSVIDLVI